MSLRFLADFQDVAVWFTTIAVLAFLVEYTWFAPWWKDAVGRTIVFIDCCLLLLLIPSVIELIWPSVTFFQGNTWDFVTTLDIYLVGLVALSRLFVWYRIRREGRRGT